MMGRDDGPKISILSPTRGRPNNVVRLIESVRNTVPESFPVELIFYVDDDDSSMSEFDELFEHDNLVKFIRGPRTVLSECWNRCAEKADADVLMQCGDDIIFRTTNWHNIILSGFDRYEDKIVLVHGEDGIQGRTIATHGFIHRKWMDTVGYFVPPYFSSDYNDLWLTEVADALGRRIFFPHVFTEHMHFLNNKARKDKTHIERIDRHHRDNVDVIWNETKNKRLEDIDKLRKVISGYGEIGKRN